MGITSILSRYSKQCIAFRALIRNELYSHSVSRIPEFLTWNPYSRNMSSVRLVPREEITKRVLNVLKSFEKVDKTKLSVDARFMPTLGLDSLDHVEVLMALEEEFDLEIPDKIADSVMTPKEAIEYIYSELNQNTENENETSHH